MRYNLLLRGLGQGFSIIFVSVAIASAVIGGISISTNKP
jgi:hypothetical protein